MFIKAARNKRRIESPPEYPRSTEPRLYCAKPSEPPTPLEPGEIPTDPKRPRLVPARKPSVDSQTSALTPLSRSQTPTAPSARPAPPAGLPAPPIQLPSPPITATLLPSAESSATSSSPRGLDEDIIEANAGTATLSKDINPNQSTMRVDEGTEDNMAALKRELYELKRDTAYQQDLIQEQKRQLRHYQDEGPMDTAEADDANHKQFMLHTRAYFTHALFFSMIMASGSDAITTGIANNLAQFTQVLVEGTGSPGQEVEASMLEELFNKAWDVLQQVQLTVSTLDVSALGGILQEWRDGLLSPPAKIVDTAREAVALVESHGMDIVMAEKDQAAPSNINAQITLPQPVARDSSPVEEASETSKVVISDTTGATSNSNNYTVGERQQLIARIMLLDSQLQREKTRAQGALRQVKHLQGLLDEAKAIKECAPDKVHQTVTKEEHDEKLAQLAKAEASVTATGEELSRNRMELESKQRMLREEIEKSCKLERDLLRERETITALQADIATRNQAFQKMNLDKHAADGVIHEAVRRGNLSIKEGTNEIMFPLISQPPHTSSASGSSKRSSSYTHSQRVPTNHNMTQPTQVPPTSGPVQTHFGAGPSQSKHSTHQALPTGPQPSNVATAQQYHAVEAMEAQRLLIAQQTRRAFEHQQQLIEQQRLRMQQQLASSIQLPSSSHVPASAAPSQSHRHSSATHEQLSRHPTLDAHLGNAPPHTLSNQYSHLVSKTSRPLTPQQPNDAQRAVDDLSIRYPVSPSPPLDSIDQTTGQPPKTLEELAVKNQALAGNGAPNPGALDRQSDTDQKSTNTPTNSAAVNPLPAPRPAAQLPQGAIQTQQTRPASTAQNRFDAAIWASGV